MLNKLLRLERPLAFLDLETTGLNKDRDRIIQIAVTIHYPHRDPIAWASLVNPGVPITNQGSHHITDADVADAPMFKEIAPALAPKILEVDIAGHNVGGFDVDFLKAEMSRCGVSWLWNGHVVDTLSICRLKLPHTLGNAYKRFVDPAGIKDAHDAANDVIATEKVLAAQLNEFQDLPRTVKELAEFCLNRNPNAIDKKGKFVWDGDLPCITFGKHRGKSLQYIVQTDRKYLIWLINDAKDFPDDALLICAAALKNEFPVKTITA